MNIVSEKPCDPAEIIELTGVHPKFVKNIFMYGSRVYGTNRIDSDYDIIVVANQMDRHKESRVSIGTKLLNIHVYTPDVFKEELQTLNIMNLECYFLPEQFILCNNVPLDNQFVVNNITVPFTIDRKKLVKNIFSQSFNSWRGAKRSLISGDPVRGVKGAFHSIRMLMFAIQILENGRITDYAQGNSLFKEMDECNETEWDYYKETYLPIKIELENRMKNLVR